MEPILVDPDAIMARIRELDEEKSELHSLLDRLNLIRKFAVPVKSANGNGHVKAKTVKANPFVDRLREFVLSRSEDFNHQELKAALGNSDRRAFIRDAIEEMQKEGLLKVIHRPMGRQPGLYRPFKKESEK